MSANKDFDRIWSLSDHIHICFYSSLNYCRSHFVLCLLVSAEMGKFSFNDERQYGNAKWLWRENSARMSATDGTATSNPRLASVQLMSTVQLPLLLMLPTLTD